MQYKRLERILQLDAVLLALLLVSLGVNVYLGIWRTHGAASPQNRPQLISAGVHAPIFEGTSPTGAKVVIDYARDTRTTLLYVFSPVCHWCESNLANIRAIVKFRSDLHVVGVNIGPRLDADAAAKQPFAEIVTPSPETSRAYRFGGTPSTLLISGNGTVLKSWTGAYLGRTAQDVSATLSVALPGLVDVNGTTKGN